MVTPESPNTELLHTRCKHVVFGKVVSGIALLKKLEAVGSETGNPSYQVKIVDCGEVSNTNSQDPLKGDKVSSKTDNSSSDSEKGGHRTKRSLPKGMKEMVLTVDARQQGDTMARQEPIAHPGAHSAKRPIMLWSIMASKQRRKGA